MELPFFLLCKVTINYMDLPEGRWEPPCIRNRPARIKAPFEWRDLFRSDVKPQVELIFVFSLS